MIFKIWLFCYSVMCKPKIWNWISKKKIIVDVIFGGMVELKMVLGTWFILKENTVIHSNETIVSLLTLSLHSNEN